MSGNPKHPDGKLKRVYRQRRLEAIGRRWDKRAAEWDSALGDPDCYLNEDDAYNKFLRLARQVILKRKQFCKKHGIIDAGCGTGLVLAELISCFAWGVGVDISREMIRLAVAKKISHARFRTGDCFALSRIRPKAGAVISRGVLLSHYGQVQGEELLRSARKALAPSGFALFDFLNEGSRQEHIHLPKGKIYFTPQQILDMAIRAGFSKASIRGGSERRVLLLLAEVG